MSRITDYILEPKIVYTDGGFLVRVKVQDDYKYKKYLVSESVKYVTVENTSFTLTNADSTKQASILELQGNTTQEGTPTPTSPVEVKTVSGDNNIVVSNKNLFDSNKAQIGKAWNNTSNTARAIVIIKVEPNTKYTISFQSITGLELWWFGRANENDSTRTDGNYQITTSPTTITTNATTNYLGLQFNKTSIAQSDIDNCNLQLEKGNQATTYIEHQGNSYRVDLGGKNITSPQNVQTAQNVVNTLNDDGSITSIGTPNTGYFNITSARSFELPIGTYTFSIDATRQYLTALSLEDESGTKESKYIRIGDKSVTFTTTEKKVKFYFWSYATNGTPVNETIKYQLEKRKYSNRI